MDTRKGLAKCGYEPYLKYKTLIIFFYIFGYMIIAIHFFGEIFLMKEGCKVQPLFLLPTVHTKMGN
jgi:hypothetical protein